MINRIRMILAREEGASAVEYGLLVAAIAAVIVGTVIALGGVLDGAFTDVNTAVREATSFMRTRVSPRASQAYFITCYDGLVITRETLNELRERFIDFNGRYSLGDVRYGGSHVAKTFVVSTAIQSASRSNHFETRPEALAVLHRQIRA